MVAVMDIYLKAPALYFLMAHEGQLLIQRRERAKKSTRDEKACDGVGGGGL